VNANLLWDLVVETGPFGYLRDIQS
jgi:hypothetical protein